MVRFQVKSARAASSSCPNNGVKQLAANARSLVMGCHRHFRDFKFSVTHATERTAANTLIIDNCKKYLAA